MQLNNTYTVHDDGTITLHVAQAPPNPNLFQPGPAFLFVTVHGIPSNGTMVIIGNGQIGTQPTSAVSVLPPNVRSASATGSANGSNSNNNNNKHASASNNSGSSSHTGAVVGVIIAAIAATVVLGAAITMYLSRRRRRAQMPDAPSMRNPAMLTGAGSKARGFRSSDSSAFMPLQQDNFSHAWNASTASLPYQDHDGASSGRPSGLGMNVEYDPYAASPAYHGTAQHRY